MATVLFICIHNAGRSQMAEALFNKISEGRHRGISAGSRPAEGVNLIMIGAMREIGINISGTRPKKLTKDLIL
jgi:arsenate reductase